MLDTEIPNDFGQVVPLRGWETVCGPCSASPAPKTPENPPGRDSVSLPCSVPAATPSLQHKAFPTPGIKMEYPGILNLLEMGIEDFI